MGGLMLDTLVLLVELLALLLLVSAMLALVARRLGLARVQRWLGGSRLTGAGKGILVGFLIPFCSYSAIPAFVGMVDARLRTATLAGFLLAAPVLDPLVFAVLALLFGWQATLAYALATAVAVLALAVAADALGAERLLRRATRHAQTPVNAVTAGSEPGAPQCCGGDPFTDSHPWQGLCGEVTAATRYAVALVRRLTVPMLLALALAALIVGFVPEQLLARTAGPDNPLAVPTAALLGAPFYVSTEAFLPVAASLHQRGMSLGAVFALVISAAGVNVPELALLARLLRPLLLAAYAAAVVAIAITAGYLIPHLL